MIKLIAEFNPYDMKRVRQKIEDGNFEKVPVTVAILNEDGTINSMNATEIDLSEGREKDEHVLCISSIYTRVSKILRWGTIWSSHLLDRSMEYRLYVLHTEASNRGSTSNIKG